VRGQFGIDGAGFDDADPDASGEKLLTERLGERVDAELGEVIDAAARTGDPPRGRADVDDVRDPQPWSYHHDGASLWPEPPRWSIVVVAAAAKARVQ
jgi:hypothetical protein